MRRLCGAAVLLAVLCGAAWGGTLGVDAHSFVEDFNRAGVALKTGLQSSPPKIQAGAEQDTFISTVGKYSAMTGTVDKEWGLLSSVTIIGAGDGTKESGAAILLGVGQFIAAADPELTAEERGQVMKDVGLLSGIKDGAKGECVKNGLRYSFSFSSTVGLWFTVEEAE